MASNDLFKSAALYLPTLDEVREVMESALKSQYKELSVEVTECPDLTQMPWDLASQGLGGETATLHLGGVPYLFPVPDQSKTYELKEIVGSLGLADAFVLGAGAACRQHVGVNSELMPNLLIGGKNVNKSRSCKLSADKGGYSVEMYDCTKTGPIADLFVSEGTPGPVIQVHAKQRTGEKNFISAIREALTDKYGSKPVGMGGVFQIMQGKAHMHVMSDFCDSPLDTTEKINNWLKFFEIKSPLICLSAMVSDDLGMDLRLEHTHCFSHHGDGGHYHYDTTPEDVEYLGYFNLAKKVCRYDQPPTPAK